LPLRLIIRPSDHHQSHFKQAFIAPGILNVTSADKSFENGAGFQDFLPFLAHGREQRQRADELPKQNKRTTRG